MRQLLLAQIGNESQAKLLSKAQITEPLVTLLLCDSVVEWWLLEVVRKLFDEVISMAGNDKKRYKYPLFQLTTTGLLHILMILKHERS